jgi:hypothetical protein
MVSIEQDYPLRQLAFVRKTSTISDMKKYERSVTNEIKGFVEQYPEGEPFSTSELLGMGTRSAVDKALSRLATARIIERVVPGIYVRPRTSRYVGKVMPTPAQVAEAAVRATGSVLEVSGAEAAREFGLTTQVPMQSTFVTSGPSRTIKYGASTIVLRHAAPKHMLFAGEQAGRAYAALRYLGKGGITTTMIERVRERLEENEFNKLVSNSSRSQMPGWISEALYSYERSRENDVSLV